MKVKGDIRVWVDGERCCARLTADGRQGPIAIQACAPLAAVRRFVKRALAERGQEMSGAEPEFDALVGRVARRMAMGRLMRLAPAAFVPGGVGAAVATRELRRRRRARLRAQPGPGKPVGPAREDDACCEESDQGTPERRDDVEHVRRLRRHHHHRHLRPDGVMGWRRRHRHPERGPALLGDESLGEMGWRRHRHARRQALLGAGPPPAAMVLAPPQVQAAAALLSAAQRHPAAARKVARIAVRAQGGDPKAQHAMRALRVAKRLRSKQTKRSVARLATAQPPAPLLPPPRPAPLLPPLPSHGYGAPAPRPPASRLHRLFWAWDPEHQKGRG